MNDSASRREEVVDVVAVEINRDPLGVAVEVIGVLPVRVAVVEEAERVVEALLVRLSGRARHPEPPLADDGRTVAGVAQQHRDGHVVWPQRDLAVASESTRARCASRS